MLRIRVSAVTGAYWQRTGTKSKARARAVPAQRSAQANRHFAPNDVNAASTP